MLSLCDGRCGRPFQLGLAGSVAMLLCLPACFGTTENPQEQGPDSEKAAASSPNSGDVFARPVEIPEPYAEDALPEPVLYLQKNELGDYDDVLTEAPDNLRHYAVYRNEAGQLLRERNTSAIGFNQTTDQHFREDGSLHLRIAFANSGNPESFSVFLPDGTLRYHEAYRGSELTDREVYDNAGNPLKVERFELGKLIEEVTYGEGQAQTRKAWDTRGRKHGWWEEIDAEGLTQKQEFYDRGDLTKYWVHTYRGDRVVSQLFEWKPGDEFEMIQAFETDAR